MPSWRMQLKGERRGVAEESTEGHLVNVANEVVVRQIQTIEAAQLAQLRGDGTGEGVETQVQTIEAAQLAQLRGNGTGEVDVGLFYAQPGYVGI